MPSPEEQDERLAAALTKEISVLHDTYSCSICHGILSAPVSLPCSHIFCSECARRHLRNKSVCPHPTCRKPTTYTQLTPLRTYDVALEPLRRATEKVEPLKLSAESRLIFLSQKSSSRAQLLERLRANDIPTQGGTDAIANRYNEFVIRWNANLDAGVPKSRKAIVAAVMAAEKEAAKQSKRSRVTSSFFKKVTSQESKAEDQIPTQGDDFDTLVKKMRARMEKKRKHAAEAQTTNKRICSDKAGHDQKTKLGSQVTLRKDSMESIDNDARPPEAGTSSQKADLREDSSIIRNVPRDDAPSRSDKTVPCSASHGKRADLTFHQNVCSVDVRMEDIKSDFENTPKQANANRQTANVVLPHASIWSQTTPDKQTVAVSELHPGFSQKRDVATIRSSTPTKVPRSAENIRESSAALSILKDDSKGRSAIGKISPSTAIAKRSRASSDAGSPMPDRREVNNDPPGSVEQLSFQRNTYVETESVLQNPRNRYRDVGSPSSTKVTPTKAQLERAERNRLAAIERRRKFYERQELSQMRQPDL